MRVGRRLSTALRATWFALWALLCLKLLNGAAAEQRTPTYPVQRYIVDAAPPQVFARGTLRERIHDGELPTLCMVSLEQQVPDGGRTR